jgi:DNA polymerase-3 subunit alpha
VLKTAVEGSSSGGHRPSTSPGLPLDDEPTYEMLARGETVGVFQVESAGMRKALIGMKPDRIEDIIALVALYRPGRWRTSRPTTPASTARRSRLDPSEDRRAPGQGDAGRHRLPGTGDADRPGAGRLHARTGRPAAPRHGQEDPRRDGHGQQQAEFVQGAVANGVKEKDAAFIFELVDKFAGYGFNKSHAAAYALVAYHTAYLKANFREEFFAASMTLDMANTDKLRRAVSTN